MDRTQDIKIAEMLGWQNISSGEFPIGQFEGTGWKPVPEFSTDIRAAWTLVEHLRDKWTTATNVPADAPSLPGSFRSFVAPFDDGAFFDILHRNADRRWPWAFLYVTPEAICRAFLAAMEDHSDEA